MAGDISPKLAGATNVLLKHAPNLSLPITNTTGLTAGANITLTINTSTQTITVASTGGTSIARTMALMGA